MILYKNISCFIAPIMVLLVSCQTVQEFPLEVEEEPETIVEAITPEVVDLVTAFINNMTIEEKVGQMLLPGLTTNRGNWGTQIDEVQHLISQYHVGGIILYRPNVTSRTQLTTLTADLQGASELPLFIAIDHEGGWVNRLRELQTEGVAQIPSASEVGARKDAGYAYNLARIMADDLNSLGINMNLAPVADLIIVTDNPVTRHRSYGSNAAMVEELVQATVRGFQEMGVLPVLKHFPGHGSVNVDSHLSLPRSQRTRLQLIDDISPFLAGLQSGANAIMVSHVSFPEAFSYDLPSSLSPEVLQFLREELSFSGVTMTDSLRMSGVAERVPEESLYIQAVQAGEDILLRPSSVAVAYETLMGAVADGTISEERVNESVRRVLELKITRGLMKIGDDLSVSAQSSARRFSAEERNALWETLR